MKINMKKFLICLFSFLFIGCSIAGGAVLLSNSSYSDNFGNGNLSQDENEIDQNADWKPGLTQPGTMPTNDDYWTDSGNYATSFAGGIGSFLSPYLISTPEQLARVAYLVNSGKNYSSCYALTKNLDLSAHYWVPIGLNTTWHEFRGQFDGNGYTITGLYINSDSAYTGFFGSVFGYNNSSNQAAVEVHDINIVSANISGTSNVGGIIGYSRASSSGINVYNCSFSGEVSGSYNVGGIIGCCSALPGSIDGYKTNISNCYNYSEVNASSVESCNAGGIIGSVSVGETNISYCYNVGDVTNSSGVDNSYAGAGGIAGYIGSGIINIKNCYNRGDITMVNSNDIYDYCAGGIIGWDSSNETSIIANCYNTGTVSALDCAGGVIGGAAGGLYTNCFNTGYVSPGADDSGGVSGIKYYGATVSYCYWGGNCTLSVASGSGSVTNCGTMTESDAKLLSWYTSSSVWNPSYKWDFTNIWKIESEQNDEYPIFNLMTYTVTYNANGGEGIMSDSIKTYDIDLILAANSFSRTGYTFQGWATSSSGSVSYANGATYSRNANITLYAVWARNTYTITYNANGGEGTMASSTKTYGIVLTLRKNTFTRKGYTFQGWATSTTGSVVYVDEGTYTANASDILYAVWDIAELNITIDWQLGNNEDSLIYLYYNQYYADDSGVITAFDFNTIEHSGFSFGGCFTSPNGQGNMTITTNGEFVSTTITQEDDTWYCYWVANNKAYYDGDGYWYVEIGKMPQSKVDATLKSTLSSNWSSLTTGDSYYLGGTILSSKVYNNKEYCLYNNEYYLVEPIRWRLTYSSNQTTGYGTTEDTLAIMDTIVYVGQYSDVEINAGAGYSLFAVTELKNNILETTFLANETKSMPTFGSTSLNGTAESVTSNIFVASSEEIEEVADSGKIEFSDLVKDYLMASGKDTLYYTRDLGTNYNNLLCMNGNGDKVQYKAQNYLGMQFSIVVTEYACV